MQTSAGEKKLSVSQTICVQTCLTFHKLYTRQNKLRSKLFTRPVHSYVDMLGLKRVAACAQWRRGKCRALKSVKSNAQTTATAVLGCQLAQQTTWHKPGIAVAIPNVQQTSVEEKL